MIASSAAIATGHPYGTSAGLELLRDGGNAVDAAVAAMIALSVVIPGSVGLGGYGGSAVLKIAGSGEQGAGSKKPQVVAVDFDSCAPLGVSRWAGYGRPRIELLWCPIGYGARRRCRA